MKDTLVDRLRDEYGVSRICGVLGASVSGYQDRRRRMPSARAQEDAVLLEGIRRLFVASHETYGSPRIHAALRQEGWEVNHKRVERLMREHDIVPHPTRRFRTLSRRAPGRTAAPNLLNQNFDSDAPNRVWLVDSTEFVTDEGKLYLSVVEDLYSRRVVGWATGSHFNQELVCQALRTAFVRRGISPHTLHKLVHHSDQGAQYTSDAYQQLLAKHHTQVSMSDAGNCYDNAPMESLISSIKKEWTTSFVYHTRRQLQNDLLDYIELFYNRQRLHSSIGNCPPVTFEERYYQLQQQLRLNEKNVGEASASHHE